MSKLTLTELKKELKKYDQKQLTQLVVDLFKLNDEFFSERGFGKMRLSEEKNAISKFKKLSSDDLKTIDLMLYYVEIGTEFTNTYGDIDEKFYSSMVSMYRKVVGACDQDEKIYDIFADRLYAVVDESEGIGWGYHEALDDLYYSLEWSWEERE